MRILAIESSAVAASAALSEDDKLLGEFFLNVGLTHSTTLMPMVDALLQYAGTSVRDVDLFVVTNGPGSFTGVRIGVSTVKGLAMGTDKPCVGVSSLEAMAYNALGRPELVCCAMDARCGQVYTALFRSADGYMERLLPDSAMSVESLGELLREMVQPVLFVGDGAALCYASLSGSLPDARLAPAYLRYPRAGSAAAAVVRNAAAHPSCSADELSVSYLRLSQAERERKEKMEAQNS